MKRNVIGPQVRRLRCKLNWSQNDLAIKLQLHGWDVCRQTIARIEAQEMWVGDYQMYYLAEVLKVEVAELLPKIETKRPIHGAMCKLLGRADHLPAVPDSCPHSRTQPASQIK